MKGNTFLYEKENISNKKIQKIIYFKSFKFSKYYYTVPDRKTF